MKKTPHRLCTSMGCFFNEQICKPGSVCAAIYLDAPLPMRSSRLHGTTGPVVCPSTALLRIEFTAPFRLRTVGELLPRLSTLTCKAGGISLLHLSWGHPRRALPVILALWSPDFPHLGPFGSHPRLSAPVADLLYFMGRKKSNVLQILFREDILYGTYWLRTVIWNLAASPN